VPTVSAAIDSTATHRDTTARTVGNDWNPNMTPDAWTNNDPGDLPVRWRENDETDVCARCGGEIGLDGATLCEACHELVSASVPRGGNDRS